MISVIVDLRMTIIGANHLDTLVASGQLLEKPFICHRVFVYTPNLGLRLFGTGSSKAARGRSEREVQGSTEGASIHTVACPSILPPAMETLLFPIQLLPRLLSKPTT